MNHLLISCLDVNIVGKLLTRKRSFVSTTPDFTIASGFILHWKDEILLDLQFFKVQRNSFMDVDKVHIVKIISVEPSMKNDARPDCP